MSVTATGYDVVQVQETVSAVLACGDEPFPPYPVLLRRIAKLRHQLDAMLPQARIRRDRLVPDSPERHSCCAVIARAVEAREMSAGNGIQSALDCARALAKAAGELLAQTQPGSEEEPA